MPLQLTATGTMTQQRVYPENHGTTITQKGVGGADYDMDNSLKQSVSANLVDETLQYIALVAANATPPRDPRAILATLRRTMEAMTQQSDGIAPDRVVSDPAFPPRP
jgi:hypothetical protein